MTERNTSMGTLALYSLSGDLGEDHYATGLSHHRVTSLVGADWSSKAEITGECV